MGNQEQITNIQEYGLIEAVPSTPEEVQAELTVHTQVWSENRKAETYDQWKLSRIALANMNQLFEGEVSRTAIVDAYDSVGKFEQAA